MMEIDFFFSMAQQVVKHLLTYNHSITLHYMDNRGALYSVRLVIAP